VVSSWPGHSRALELIVDHVRLELAGWARETILRGCRTEYVIRKLLGQAKKLNSLRSGLLVSHPRSPAWIDDIILDASAGMSGELKEVQTHS